MQEAKSLMAQSVVCELNLLQMGHIECADIMLKYRDSAELRAYIVECLLSDYPAQNKELVEYLFEQIKELVLMINQNKC